MTNEELCEIMDNSNFMIDSNNKYDMKIYELLKKQIPKKPINGHPRDYRCPYCYNDVYGDGFYCGICGQALDWGDDDD